MRDLHVMDKKEFERQMKEVREYFKARTYGATAGFIHAVISEFALPVAAALALIVFIMALFGK